MERFGGTCGADHLLFAIVARVAVVVLALVDLAAGRKAVSEPQPLSLGYAGHRG